MRSSPTIGALAAALADARKDFSVIVRSKTVKVKSQRTGAEYTFKYAPYEEMVEATWKPLADQGLTVHSSVEGESLVMRLIHSSGEWIEVGVPFPPLATGLTPQELGSHLSYRMRYGYRHLLNLPADEDDDGNIAEGNAFEASKAAPGAPNGPKAVPRAKPASKGPVGRLETLKRIETAVLRQLVAAKLVDAAVTEPDGLIREALRVSLMHTSEFNPLSEEDMQKWVNVLTKFRDDNVPPVPF